MRCANRLWLVFATGIALLGCFGPEDPGGPPAGPASAR
jgi:hypothetical protein